MKLKKRLLCLLIVVLTIGGCGSLQTQSIAPIPQSIPPLDTGLSKPCEDLKVPAALDYDVWLSWMVDALEKYGDCAARHELTVSVWPK